jgi:hypothetical protein
MKVGFYTILELYNKVACADCHNKQYYIGKWSNKLKFTGNGDQVCECFLLDNKCDSSGHNKCIFEYTVSYKVCGSLYSPVKLCKLKDSDVNLNHIWQ